MTELTKRWYISDIAVDLYPEGSADPVMTIEISAPGGVLLVMGEPVQIGRTLRVERVHIQSLGFNPNSVGVRNLRVVAQAIMEILDYENIIIEGEVRTTGAGQGRRSGVIRFARNRNPASRS